MLGQLRQTFLTPFGICAGPDDVYQVLRGLRSMGVRLERISRARSKSARWLEGKPGVARVLHPALESHPGHALWKRDFCGASGLFSIVLANCGEKGRLAFLDALEIFGLGYSWGGYESLAVPFSLKDRTIAKGPYEGPLIRLQIGLEDVEDLKADLERGLAAARDAKPHEIGLSSLLAAASVLCNTLLTKRSEKPPMNDQMMSLAASLPGQ